MTSSRRLRALRAMLVAAAALAATATPAATPRSPAESDQLARAVLAELVGLDTTHAVGSAKAAEALAARFRAAGFPAEDVYVGGPKPDKMNIVVRLHGRGRGKPVLFNAHLDVVEAIRDTWSVEPFALTEKDGYFYGRGTQDVKEEVAILTANLVRLRREGWKPDRDVILFFNVDEEAGGDANGVEWMLATHRPLIEAGLVINQDAGHVHAQGGKPLWNSLQTTAKVYAHLHALDHGQRWPLLAPAARQCDRPPRARARAPRRLPVPGAARRDHAALPGSPRAPMFRPPRPRQSTRCSPIPRMPRRSTYYGTRRR